ncbi:transposase [Staphylococcus phage vB_SauM-HM01]|nr:putative transposase [Staphylococcus phage SAPYZU_15]UGL60766.1 transposase [Staphylococcus phage vB_SauM-HM01]UVD42331.1 hypothetical protein [Staphylococcus phage vB_SauM-V1SA19]BBM81331.1 putative transposase [Staphylococcus phage KSAP7]BBM81518.1 putative transposase [Staphylococcus phage KSAP11]
MIKPKDMAEKLGVSVKTLQRWDREGILIAKRSPKNRRYYTEEQYLDYIGEKIKETRYNIAYCRVSNRSQKYDLVNQEKFIKTYANNSGTIIDDYMSDIGSGLNYKRKNWNKLLKKVSNNEVDKIFITYKDRFIRFGYEWFESYCNNFNTEIVVLNDKDTSPEQELVDDLISIIHVFSCRIYGLRKYKTKVKNDDEL